MLIDDARFSRCCDWGTGRIGKITTTPDIPTTDDCAQCPDGAAQYWEFALAGIANDGCPFCDEFDGTYVLPYIGSCGWRYPTTGTFTNTCGRNNFFILSYGSRLTVENGHSAFTDTWRLRFWFQGIGTLLEGGWEIDPANFDCTGPNILTRYYTNFQVCTNFPASLTITPTTAP